MSDLFIEHIPGEYIDNVQRCMLCGEIICDYRNAMWPEGMEPPQGWPEGEPVYISSETNPTMYLTEMQEGDTKILCLAII